MGDKFKKIFRQERVRIKQLRKNYERNRRNNQLRHLYTCAVENKATRFVTQLQQHVHARVYTYTQVLCQGQEFCSTFSNMINHLRKKSCLKNLCHLTNHLTGSALVEPLGMLKSTRVFCLTRLGRAKEILPYRTKSFTQSSALEPEVLRTPNFVTSSSNWQLRGNVNHDHIASKEKA